IPKRMTPGIFQDRISCAAATASSGESRNTPGSDEISSRSPLPCRTKRGARNRSGVSRVSRTRARSAGLLRRRRIRTFGKEVIGRIYGFGAKCSRCNALSGSAAAGRNRLEEPAGTVERRLAWDLDPRDAVRRQESRRETPEGHRRRFLQSGKSGLADPGEEPAGGRGGRHTEGGEGACGDLRVQTGIVGPRDFSIEDERRDVGAALHQARRKLLRCVLSSRKKDSLTFHVRRQRRQDGLGRA